jgi:hypothetical protein
MRFDAAADVNLAAFRVVMSGDPLRPAVRPTEGLLRPVRWWQVSQVNDRHRFAGAAGVELHVAAEAIEGGAWPPWRPGRTLLLDQCQIRGRLPVPLFRDV